MGTIVDASANAQSKFWQSFALLRDVFLAKRFALLTAKHHITAPFDQTSFLRGLPVFRREPLSHCALFFPDVSSTVAGSFVPMKGIQAEDVLQVH
jgi:hypothetical protein